MQSSGVGSCGQIREGRGGEFHSRGGDDGEIEVEVEIYVSIYVSLVGVSYQLGIEER